MAHFATKLSVALRRRIKRAAAPLWQLVVAADLAKDLPARGRITWRTSAPPVQTPELLDPPLVLGARGLRQPVYHPPEVPVALLTDVSFGARDHVVASGRRRVLVESVSTGYARQVLGIPALLRRREKYLPGTFTTIRSVRNRYYHEMVDNLPRLFLLHQAREMFKVDPELLVSSPLTPTEAYFLPILGHPGMRVRQVDPAKWYHLEHFLFVGFFTRNCAGWLPPEYMEWFRERVLPRRPSQRNRRIWISRQVIEGRHMRNVLNEDVLMDALLQRGFEKVRPELMSMPEQIELFHDAEMIVGPHGAGLTNMIFSTGVKVLELFPSRWVVPHYYFLARACGHSYAWLNGDGRHQDSNFAAPVRDVVGLVKEWERGNRDG